ncbi:MAG: sulfotransferase family protein [Terriglobales bacterium]
MPEIDTSAILGITETVPSPLSSQLSRLVFVGGSPRSGTTLVQRILDYHPEIYAGPEFDFVPAIVDLFQNMRRSVRSGRIDAILDEHRLVSAFRNLLIDLLLPKLRAEGVSFLCEKTPGNVFAFSWLEEYAPEAKKILVLRDPRDVVSSMLEVGRRQRRRQGRTSGFVRDTISAVGYMNQCLKAGTAVAESSANCLVIYYEDVVSNPLAVANRMYRFIGIHEMQRLDLENEHFEAARNRDSWIDWVTPGTVDGGVQKDRVGAGGRRLKRNDLEYICAQTIYHPLLLNRYSIPSPRWTIAARWCMVRCLALRFKEALPGLWYSLRRQLTQ